MNLKKFAVRGLIILAVVVALCMFFSGTIRTITTAKVKILMPRQGKLVQTVELSGKVVFPEAEPIKLEGADDVSLTILSVKVQTGSEVEEGDVLFTAEIANFDKDMQELRNSYNQIADQLDDLERKNRSLRLTRTDEDWASTYYALSDARAAELEARVNMDALLSVEGLEMDGDKLPKKASDELEDAYDKRLEAGEALKVAEANMRTVDRYNVSEVTRTYITSKKKYQDQMDELEAKMVELNVLRNRLSAVTAPEDGYITEINLKSGEAFAPKSVAYFFCSEKDKPVLRVDTNETKLNISKGTDVTFEGAKGKMLDSEVESIGLTVEGATYADVELTNKLIKDMGGSVAMLAGEIKVFVEYKARENTTLLPTSAVRSDGEAKYVYVIQEQQSAFGVNSLVIQKQDVTVLAEAEGMVSVGEDLSYMRVAYMEDRAISENSTVMEYVN